MVVPPALLSPAVFSGEKGPPFFGPFPPAPSVGAAEAGLPAESGASVPVGVPELARGEGIETIYHVPIVYNEYVEGYLTLFQTRLRERFEVWLARSGRYVPMMQNILKRKEIPEDLVFLALIESGFNPQAHSVASAVGPWQFIKSTGERYGLRVDKWIDERRDPVKSTVAAARYLKDLYRMFQSWSLSMASYNAGEGRIMRALASSKTEDFWQLKETSHIKDETKNYVPKFMAATLIAKNPEKYGFFVDYHEPLSYEEVKVSKQTSLKSIAKAVGISVQQMQQYNPELKRDTTPPNYPGYHVKIPHGTKARFLAAFSKSTHKQVKKKAVSSPKKRGKKRRGSRNDLTQLPPEKSSASSS
jgi:membrane-bound lytic murein transglycosylase D